MRVSLSTLLNNCPQACIYSSIEVDKNKLHRYTNGTLEEVVVYVGCEHYDVCKLRKEYGEPLIMTGGDNGVSGD